MSASCCACSAGPIVEEFATPRLTVLRCRACGHRIARHAAVEPKADYHRQYDQGAFVDVLRVTRERQARDILRWIRAAAPAATRLLDYGCGRGWFLDAAKADGWDVLGFDTSPMAVDLLRQRGISATAELPAGKTEVITLLDVIEHFRPDDLIPRLSALKADLVVIKVPTSSGLLYRLARGRALERLYQVGTDPPHHHYFNERSLRHVLSRAGMRVIEIHRDRDFEPSTLAARAGLRVPLARFAAAVVAAAAQALRMEDSLICLARPTAA